MMWPWKYHITEYTIGWHTIRTVIMVRVAFSSSFAAEASFFAAKDIMTKARVLLCMCCGVVKTKKYTNLGFT